MRPRLPGWARHALLRRQYRRQALAHVEARHRAVQGALDDAQPGYVLLLGDSHAELVGRHALGGLPVVNAGIGGLSSRRCALYLPRLHVTVRASVAILSTGSNDIMACADPLSAETSAGFEQAVTEILDWLHVHAYRTCVLAIPPIEHLPEAPRVQAAVEDYSHRLERLARRYDCAFADPYAALRDRGGLARPGALIDGVHLADYAGLADRLLPLLQQDVPIRRF